ncbi:MAG: amidophosphoribosyltransferase [Clostridia bacterium]|nr:amidophosphoribosyltransferase [Clostridia bacterium]
MGGFFGAVSERDVILDVFFGTDYHSHLGTLRGGIAALTENGFDRHIHNIENTPFRTKLEKDIMDIRGRACIGCISDTDPQPIIIRSHLGTYAISTIGIIRNIKELTAEIVDKSNIHFSGMSGGKINTSELTAALINTKADFVEGIKFAHDKIEGSISILILTDKYEIIAARDKSGRLPILVGKDEHGYCVSFESFAYEKLGYKDEHELGCGEVVKITADKLEVLSPPNKCKKRICSFLWTYYGYPNSHYEGVNVEVMRYRNGEIMANADKEKGVAQNIDYVCGVPDSGLPHAIGYSNASVVPFARPFVKYTPTWPRSFMPTNQNVRNQVAKMKLIPVTELINGKKLLFVDDSIVRGTQLRETVEFLYENGAKEVHMRSACPPIMFGCKYLNFSASTSEMELIARRTIAELEGDEGEKHLDEYADASSERGKKLRETIAEKLKLDSLEYQTLEGLIEAIGLDRDEICTYCWDGRE